MFIYILDVVNLYFCVLLGTSRGPLEGPRPWLTTTALVGLFLCDFSHQCRHGACRKAHSLNKDREEAQIALPQE